MTFLRGKVAIVTGAAVGLGNAFARALAGQGADVVVCDIRPEISELTAELEAGGTRALALEADVARPADVRRVVDAAVSAFGGIDVLVNNAGTWAASLADDPLDKSLEDYERLVGTNLKGEFLFGRAVMPHMIERGKGTIVNIGGGSAHSGVANRCHVTTAKAGVAGLTGGLAAELAPHGITVNCIVPGRVDTVPPGAKRSEHRIDRGDSPMGRSASTDEIADLTLYLCGEGCRYMSGQMLHVNGARYITIA